MEKKLYRSTSRQRPSIFGAFGLKNKKEDKKEEPSLRLEYEELCKPIVSTLSRSVRIVEDIEARAVNKFAFWHKSTMRGKEGAELINVLNSFAVTISTKVRSLDDSKLSVADLRRRRLMISGIDFTTRQQLLDPLKAAFDSKSHEPGDYNEYFPLLETLKSEALKALEVLDEQGNIVNRIQPQATAVQNNVHATLGEGARQEEKDTTKEAGATGAS